MTLESILAHSMCRFMLLVHHTWASPWHIAVGTDTGVHVWEMLMFGADGGATHVWSPLQTVKWPWSHTNAAITSLLICPLVRFPAHIDPGVFICTVNMYTRKALWVVWSEVDEFWSSFSMISVLCCIAFSARLWRSFDQQLLWSYLSLFLEVSWVEGW